MYNIESKIVKNTSDQNKILKLWRICAGNLYSTLFLSCLVPIPVLCCAFSFLCCALCCLVMSRHTFVFVLSCLVLSCLFLSLSCLVLSILLPPPFFLLLRPCLNLHLNGLTLIPTLTLGTDSGPDKGTNEDIDQGTKNSTDQGTQP